MKEVVAGIILYKDRILIGKKITKEEHFVSGGWHIPGGHLFKNENKTEALKREFKEETGLDIEILHKITSSKIPKYNVKVHWYLCETKSINNLIPGDDLVEIKFVEKGKVFESCDKRATDLWPKEIVEFLNK